MSVDSPAKPALPDAAPPPARPAARDRQRRKGSALALRNWRVPWRLIALIAIPTVVAMAFAGLRVEAAADSAATFGRSAQLAVLGQQVTALAQAMEDERDLTATFIANGRPAAGRAALRRQYAVTDARAQTVRTQIREVGSAFPAQTRADAANVIARIGDLPDLRSYASASSAPALTAITAYTLANADLFTLDDDIAQQAGSSALVGKVRALGALSRMKDQTSLQRAILEAALISRQFTTGTLNTLIGAQAQQATDLASFETSATLGDTQILNNTVAGPRVDQAQALEQRAIVVGQSGGTLNLGATASRRWYADMSYTVDRMSLAERQLADSIARQAQALHQGAMRSLLLTAGVAAAVLIFVLLATLIIARSMVHPLRQLKAGALEVAGVRLPSEVRELSMAKDADQAVDVEPIGVHSTDEIGQVARAFDQVHEEAVRLAADEARLRGSVSAMFVSLSRRSQSLLERLLRLIDSLELGEQDSERLSDLFRMDHLATRMRRNSENLLVLAGQEPARRWAEPVSLADVARAAVSEIEQYERVVLDMQPGLGVTGNAVADVVHLLAEIIENATTFSAKSTHVTVSGHALRSGGVLINVIDGGMGMTQEQLTQVNWRLENPPAADVEVSRHMGLFAVAHLAARHGIRVRLRKSADGGLIAHVWLPDALISHDSSPARWESIRSARASAVVQAVTRGARFPQGPAAADSAAAFSLAAAPLAEAPLTEAPATAGLTGAGPAGNRPFPAGPVAATPPVQGSAVIVPEPSLPPPETRLPIFESVESDWFRARRRPPRRGAAPVEPRRAGRPWTSPGDDGWRAARAVLAPTTGGLTTSGLPRRTPQANLVPGSAGAREARPVRPADTAEVMSSRLAGFQRGSRRGRAAAAPPAPPPVEPP
jgi:Nitrate and nitrite sensing/HAMP domain/Histidine kinase-, DNA gyrase B-, and HSP90-like ATPase